VIVCDDISVLEWGGLVKETVGLIHSMSPGPGKATRRYMRSVKNYLHMYLTTLLHGCVFCPQGKHLCKLKRCSGQTHDQGVQCCGAQSSCSPNLTAFESERSSATTTRRGRVKVVVIAVAVAVGARDNRALKP
jgi:hypothetical protein